MTLLAYAIVLLLIGVERIVELVVSNRAAKKALARGGHEVGKVHYRWMVLMHALLLPMCFLEAAWVRDGLASTWFGLSGALDASLMVSTLAMTTKPLWMHSTWVVSFAALVFLANALRYWAIVSLRGAWSTRVIVVPGASCARGGPYRWIRHPNYVAVVLEMAALPLLAGAWWTACVFSLCNACILFVRIRCEESLLVRHTDYDEAMANKPRWLPHGRRHPHRDKHRANAEQT